MEARPHPQQTARLRALRSYEILDTDPEREFDEVARLAAKLCAAPIAVINLIDAERQWFKAEVGLGVRETPLATSICSHIILEEDFTEIEDTLADPRMADNPLCCGDPGLRFYAGALLRSDDGLPIGTLCVLDWRPRGLTPLQRDSLRVLADQVMAQLNLRRELRRGETFRKEVDHRVKNSLQLLSSLTHLQGRNARSPEVVSALEAVRSRIGVISALHDQLYRTTAGSSLDLAAYLAEVTANLGKIAPANVTIETGFESIEVTSTQAAAVGTLLNELASNAFKHAFPEGRSGRFRCVLRRADGGRILFECSDDGIGLPEEAEMSGGLGMQVAMVVSQQLGGTLDIDRSGIGATFRLDFGAAP